MTGHPVDPRDLRVSDAERAHVVSLLEMATGRGLITLGEFSDRSSAAVTAKTRGELNAVLLDLPGLSIAGLSVDQARAQAGAPDPAGLELGGPAGGPWAGPAGASGPGGWAPPPGPRPAGPYFPPGARASGPSGPPPPALELLGWGSRVYKGYWVVPSRIVIGGVGSSRLDFSSAQLTSTTVQVEFVGKGIGGVDLIVPPGTGVRLEGLQVRGGSVDNRVPPGPPPWPFVLELSGVKRGGSLRIRLSKRR